MKKGNISIGIAIAIAMTAVLAISGCVEEVGDIAEDISDIGSKDSQTTFIKGQKRLIAPDSEYALLLRHASRSRISEDGDVVEKPEVVIEIFSDFGNLSIEQRTLKTGFRQEITIERLTLELVNIGVNEEYADIRVSERVDVVGYGEKAVGIVGDVAKSVAESQT